MQSFPTSFQAAWAGALPEQTRHRLASFLGRVDAEIAPILRNIEFEIPVPFVMLVERVGTVQEPATRLSVSEPAGMRWAQGAATLGVPWAPSSEGGFAVQLPGWSKAGWEEIKLDLPLDRAQLFYTQGSPGTWKFSDDDPRHRRRERRERKESLPLTEIAIGSVLTGMGFSLGMDAYRGIRRKLGYAETMSHRRDSIDTTEALKQLVAEHGADNTFGYDEVRDYGGASPSGQRGHGTLFFTLDGVELVARPGRFGWRVSSREGS